MPKPTLPSSEQAEKGLLASFVYAPDKVFDSCSFRHVTPDWFLDSDRATFFTALGEMKKEGIFEHIKGFDSLPSVTQYCLDHEKKLGFHTSDLTHWVTSIFTFINTASNLAYYLDVLQRNVAQRQGILACKKAEVDIRSATSLSEVHHSLSAAFVEARELCAAPDTSSWRSEEIIAFLDEMEAAGKEEYVSNKWLFFLDSLDKETGGIEPGELVVIHGKTSTGKSLLSQHIVQHNVMQKGAKAAVYSAEMPHKQYLRRLTASLGEISLSSMRLGRFSKGELDRFGKTVLKIEASALWVFDMKRNRMTVDSIEASIRKIHKDKGLDIACIDYLQLLKIDAKRKRKDERSDEELQGISKSFKRLALELGIVVILLAQSGDKEMVHGCPQVESDADWVLGMVPDYEFQAGVKKVVGTKAVWVSKAREGQRGRSIPILMEGKFARISESTE